MILILGMNHRRLKLNKVYINDRPALTLTYLTTKLNFSASIYMWKMYFIEETYSKSPRCKKVNIYINILTPGGGVYYVYVIIVCLKIWAQSGREEIVMLTLNHYKFTYTQQRSFGDGLVAKQ